MPLNRYDAERGPSTRTRNRPGSECKYLCHPCFRGGERIESFGFCIGCGEYMCRRCWADHVKIKSLQEHVLRDEGSEQAASSPVSVSPADDEDPERGNREACAKHRSHIVEYYCTYCNEVCCIDCVVVGHMECYVVHFPDIFGLLHRLKEESADSDTTEQYKAIVEWMGVIRKRTALVIEKQKAHMLESSRRFRGLMAMKDVYDDVNGYLDILLEDVYTITDTSRGSNKDHYRLVINSANEALSHLEYLQADDEILKGHGGSRGDVRLTSAVNGIVNLRRCLRNAPATAGTDIGQVPAVIAGIQALVKDVHLDAIPKSKLPDVGDRHMAYETERDLAPCQVTRILLTATQVMIADRGNRKLKIFDVEKNELMTELTVDNMFRRYPLPGAASAQRDVF